MSSVEYIVITIYHSCVSVVCCTFNAGLNRCNLHNSIVTQVVKGNCDRLVHDFKKLVLPRRLFNSAASVANALLF